MNRLHNSCTEPANKDLFCRGWNSLAAKQTEGNASLCPPHHGPCSHHVNGYRILSEVAAPQGPRPQVTVTSANESSVLAWCDQSQPRMSSQSELCPPGADITITHHYHNTNICELVSQSPQIDYPGPSAKLIIIPSLFRLGRGVSVMS